MRKIRLLDCTLRDGGYINDWNFGNDNIKKVIRNLEESNIDILELGFFKNEEYNPDRTVFNSMQQVTNIITSKKKNVIYAAMCEVQNPLPLEMIPDHTSEGIDLIRVIVWKTKHDSEGNVVDALKEGYEYCKGIVEKGYKLCVQPARVDQYSDEEFISMLKMFSTLNPLAIYVVDSWGTQDEKGLMHYFNLANDTLPKSMAIGYHGHNNMLQAFGVAQSFISSITDRDIIIDGSVYGIGRGAGNLNIEVMANYMNNRFGKDYNISSFISIYSECIQAIFDLEPWGYSIPYCLTAVNNCNPAYARYFSLEKHLTDVQIQLLCESMTEEEKVMFSRKNADKICDRILK